MSSKLDEESFTSVFGGNIKFLPIALRCIMCACKDRTLMFLSFIAGLPGFGSKVHAEEEALKVLGSPESFENASPSLRKPSVSHTLLYKNFEIDVTRPCYACQEQSSMLYI